MEQHNDVEGQHDLQFISLFDSATLQWPTRDNLYPVFCKVTLLMAEQRLCPCNVLEMLRVVSQAITDAYAASEKTMLLQETTHLGLMTLEMLANLSLLRNVALTGQWERVAFAAVSFVSPWMPSVFQPMCRALPWAVKLWVGQALFSNELCPNRLLQVELLRFVAMFETEDLTIAHLAFFTLFGFLQSCVYLSASRLLPVGRSGLLCIVREVLCILHDGHQLGPLTGRSCSQIESLKVGNIERAFAYLVKLMGDSAQRLRQMRCKKMKSLRKTIKEFYEIVQILRLLTAVQPNNKLYDLPGMCQLAGGAVATTLRCIALTCVDPAAEEAFAFLLREVDAYFLRLGGCQGRGALLEDLRRYHGRDLTLFAEEMRRHGCEPLCVPEPLAERRPCVARFLDSRTKRLMTRPVRLEATGRVVDRSTLLRLMLVHETDPATDLPLEDLAYTPLDDLRDEIRAWEETVSSGERGQDEDEAQGHK